MVNEIPISLIVATGEDRAIGKDNGMLWHLPDDFRFFKNTTMGHPLIMGRKTFESLKGALPGRRNIVVSRKPDYRPTGAEKVESIEEALQLAASENPSEIFIAGGGQIYKETLDLADRLYLTLVHASFPDAEVFFPKLDADNWQEVKRIFHPADDRHQYAFTFLFLERA